MSDRIVLFHTADLHIHPSRYARLLPAFNDVIEHMVAEVAGWKGLVIAGDIYENKTTLHGSDVRVFNEFLSRAIEVCDAIVVIRGNHDYSVSKGNDLVYDTIMEHPKIHYILNTSHIVDHPRMVFHHISEDAELTLPVEGAHNIAILHETLSDALDGDFAIGQIARTSRSSADLTGYTIAMIGDIHHPHRLQHNVAYSGSLVQKTVAESPRKSIAKWTITGSNVEYSTLPIRPIQNDIIVYAKNNTLPVDLSEYVEPRNIIVYYSECNEEFVRNLQEQIGAKPHRLIRDAPAIYNNPVCDADISVKSDWSLLSMRWRNLYRYTKGSIDFTTLRGLNMLHGHNATGKSSILNILIYALYGGRGFTELTHSVILHNYNTQPGIVEVTFCKQNDTYTVVREIPRRGVANVRILKNGEQIMSGETTAANEYIDQLCGKCADFCNISVARQNRVGFAEKSNTARKEELNRYIGLADIEAKCKELKAEIKTCTIRMEEVRCNLDVAGTREALAGAESALEATQSRYEALTAELHKMPTGSDAAVCKPDFPEPIAPQCDIPALVRAYKILKTSSIAMPPVSGRVFIADEHVTIPEFAIIGENCGGNPALAGATPGEPSSISGDKLADLQRVKDKLIVQETDINKSLSQLRHERGNLVLADVGKLVFRNECAACCENRNRLDYERNKALARDLDTQITAAAAQLTHIISEQRKVDGMIAEAKRHSDNVHPQHIIDMAKRQMLYDESIADIASRGEDIQLVVDLYHTARAARTWSDYKEYITYQERNAKRLQLAELDTERRKLQQIISTHSSAIAQHEERTTRYNELAEHRAKLEAKHDKIRDLDKINEHVKYISECWNASLAMVSGLRISLGYVEGKLILDIIENGKEISASIASGYQKFILDLTLRETLARVAQIPIPDFLIIDEGFGAADEYNIAKIRDYLEFSCHKYKFVLIISHITGLNVERKLPIVSDAISSSIEVGNLGYITDESDNLVERYNVIRVSGESVVEILDSGKFRCKCCKSCQNVPQKRMITHMATPSHKKALVAYYK